MRALKICRALHQHMYLLRMVGPPITLAIAFAVQLETIALLHRQGTRTQTPRSASMCDRVLMIFFEPTEIYGYYVRYALISHVVHNG